MFLFLKYRFACTSGMLLISGHMVFTHELVNQLGKGRNVKLIASFSFLVVTLHYTEVT